MVFRTISIYVITSTFLTFFTFFFKIQKVATFYVFCCVSYVFSNYGYNFRPNKILDGKIRPKFGTISDNFRSTTAHPLLVEKNRELRSTDNKVRGHGPTKLDFFPETKFQPLEILFPHVFTRPTTPKLYFQSDLQRQVASS